MILMPISIFSIFWGFHDLGRFRFFRFFSIFWGFHVLESNSQFVDFRYSISISIFHFDCDCNFRFLFISILKSKAKPNSKMKAICRPKTQREINRAVNRRVCKSTLIYRPVDLQPCLRPFESVHQGLIQRCLGRRRIVDG